MEITSFSWLFLLFYLLWFSWSLALCLHTVQHMQMVYSWFCDQIKSMKFQINLPSAIILYNLLSSRHVLYSFDNLHSVWWKCLNSLTCIECTAGSECAQRLGVCVCTCSPFVILLRTHERLLLLLLSLLAQKFECEVKSEWIKYDFWRTSTVCHVHRNVYFKKSESQH